MEQHSSCIWVRIILFSKKEVYLYRDAFHNVVRYFTIFSKKQEAYIAARALAEDSKNILYLLVI